MSSLASALTLENVVYDKKGPIAYVTLNRPKVLNALNKATIHELKAAFEDARDDSAVRGVILTGAGEKAFAAGADIAEIANNTAVEAEEATRRGQGLTDLIENLGKPVIAAVNGFALGGGCELAMACTFRLASDTARFGQPEINLGIIPGGGGTQRLTRLVGEGKAMEMILTGEIIDAQTAFAAGLVNHVVPLDQLEKKTMEIANRIAEKGPASVSLAKEAVKIASRSNLDEGLRREVDLFALCFSTEDKDEGVSAFLEKRKPVFKGK